MITGAMSYNRYRVRRVGTDVANFIARNDAVSQVLLIPGLSGINLQRVLFGVSEPGGIWDWSDRSTMFQDSGGSTPVTASGQTVGLHLDKSQGLTLGSNVVTNGGFDSATGWVTSAGWSISGGVATATGGLGEALVQNSILTANVWYRVEFDVTNVIASGSFNVYSGTTNIIPTDTSFAGMQVSTPGRYGGYFLANGTSLCIRKAVAFQGSIDNVTVRAIAGNHRYQSSLGSRPQYVQDAHLHYGLYDGVDDFMETNAVNFTGTNKMTVWWGGRKLSDATTGNVFDLAGASGFFSLLAPSGAGSNSYRFVSRGTATQGAGTGVFAAAPDTSVITGEGSIAPPLARLRRNGLVVETVTSTQGTGNYGNEKLYFGRRSDALLPANIREYMTIIRGAATPTNIIQRVERAVARKVGISW